MSHGPADEPTFLRFGPVNWQPEDRRTIERLHQRIRELERELGIEGPLGTPVVDIPATPRTVGPIARPELAVAVILTDDARSTFGYEWDQAEFGPDEWRTVLPDRRPDLLFVAATGLDRWSAGESELRSVIDRCRAERIPTVFWIDCARSDFDAFADVARLFDHVFTAAADMVVECRAALGHDRVAMLAPAAQPRLYNPVQGKFDRSHDIGYAGPYARQEDPGFREQLDTVLRPLCRTGLHIFAEDARHHWPPNLLPHIVGDVVDVDLPTVYSMYKVFLSVHSDLDSPVDRQVVELAACATPIVSTPSTAIRDTFGALIPMVDTELASFNQIQHLLNSPELRARQGHLAMRAVHDSHLTSHRVDQILRTAGLPVPTRSRPISVVLSTRRTAQIDHAIASVAGQVHRPLQLIVILHGLDIDPATVREKAVAAGISDVVVLRAADTLTLGACLNLGIDAAEGDFIAKMDDDDLYGAHYLSDLVRAFDYTEAELVGKGAHYAYFAGDNTTMLRLPGYEHRYVNRLHGGTFLGKADLLRHYKFADVSLAEDSALLAQLNADGIKIYATDRFNFIYWRTDDLTAHTWQPTDNALVRTAQFAFVGRPHDHVLI
ncbi:glycosyltransferase family protein [Nocardia sp. CA-128927]|uniref:glycosyltransferase family protein n=1 Tax=Nocardia sp. CA-128927 TaxID=3239975 RepID=UPI003D961BEE